MKKLFSIIIMMLVSSLTSSAQYARLGDINRDNQVDINDVMTLVDIILKGYTPFSVTPDEITMQTAGSTATVNILGGYYFYEVVSADPNVVEASVFGMTVTLKAIGGGQTTVNVRDVLTFRTIDIPVTVEYDALQLSTNNITLVVGEQGIINISSGSGYYSVDSTNEGVATATESGGNVTVTAVGAGCAAITITDTKSGQTVVIEVTVNHLPLALSESSLELSIGDEMMVGITSGNGNYSVSSSEPNVATAVVNGSSVVITAVGGGSAVITVTDTSSGKTADISVTVEYFPLILSSTSLELNVGDEEMVGITSGNGSFTLQSGDTNVVTAKLVGFSVKVTAVGRGNSTITVTDTKSSQWVTIDVTVKVDPVASLCPDSNHPHMIDLGLPSGTLWSCCNLDSEHPEIQSPINFGGYYSWGETEAKDEYSWSTYIHCEGSKETCQNIGENISGSEFDVAYAKWGGMWQIPSDNQIYELQRACTFSWTSLNGINGGLFTSKTNGNRIFLPAAGYFIESSLVNQGAIGYYWVGNQYPYQGYEEGAFYFYIGSGKAAYGGSYYFNRCYGLPIRPIFKNETLQLSSAELFLITGNENSVSIISGSGNYNVQSSNTNVASANISKNSVVVTAVGSGIATITVTDTKSCQTVSISVTVHDANASLCPDDHHPHKIDLGLPSGTMWSCCNVDTKTPNNQHPTNDGTYYAWGETEEKDIYNSSTYLYRDFSSNYFTYLGESICGTQYDVAYTKWGDDWQMPSRLQCKELVSSCTYYWTYENGVLGGKFVSNYNGNCIFLPASGYRYNSTIKDYGGGGYYWVGTNLREQDNDVYVLVFASVDANGNNAVMPRDNGCTVRPVSW